LEFERTKRAVKEEASKTKVDIDILHEKLIVLENVARKRNHELKDKITLILSRIARLSLRQYSNLYVQRKRKLFSIKNQS
jgi:hypothetical protein